MNILVLGAGAIGSLLGARLSRTEASICLYSTNRRHMGTVARDGLFVEELDGSVSNFKLTTCFDPERMPWQPDVVLVVVKAYATETAVSSILHLCSASTIFLTLQNGIGNWERIAEIVGRRATLAGSTSQGATLVGSGRVRHGGNGPTFIGEPGESPGERVHDLLSLFRQAGLAAEPSEDVQKLIWEKLIVNVGINAITGLTGIRNGIIAEMRDASELCRCAVEEAIMIARYRGFPISYEMVDRVSVVARATARNRSSMAQDVDKKKKTEIDSINGAVVRLGREVGIRTPVNHALTCLVKIMENTYMAQSPENLYTA
ncbi:MAG: 2-dehydropantoate 2-reductase [Deltaproteobacteria bacterium]|nr:2-dehydropantoate 2-reductase [Deltaproteobacteria bacterium]